MKNLLKTLISIPLTIIIGGLAIIEIIFELIYQLVRLLRRVYKLGMNTFLKLVEPIYRGKWKAKVEDEDKDITILEFNYEMEEGSN